MKKNLVILLLLLFSGIIVKSQVCSPNTSLQPNQVDPDSDAGQTFINGYINTPYSATYTISVPATIDVMPGVIPPIQVNHIKYLGIDGLPPGLTAVQSTGDSLWPGGTFGCILISGTPTEAGVFNLSLKQEMSTATTLPLNNENYSITILAGTPSSVNNNSMNGIEVLATFVNDKTCTINLFSNDNTSIIISLYSLSGQLIFDNKHIVNNGENQISINMNDIKQGLYIVRIASEKSVIVQKVMF
jgi:hypothetical protein